MPLKRVASAVLDRAKPYARALKFARLYRSAVREAQRAETVASGGPVAPPVAFFLGCGRSGTTILGKVFAQHPEIRYFFEPYHLWAAIDPRTDMLGLYVDPRVEARCLMTAEMVDDAARAKFHRLIRSRSSRDPQGRARLIVEKTPINALRLGYLDALAPDAKFVHIARDGVEVCRSIERLAVGNTYRIAGKPALNQWWGVGDAKWRALARDGAAAGYYPQDVPSLATSAERGAYEWLLSLHEVERWRARLGPRLFEFTYDALTETPREMIARLCAFLEIGAAKAWLDQAAPMIDSARRIQGDPILLPGSMAEDFNRFQARYGFPGRARARPSRPEELEGREPHPMPAPIERAKAPRP